MHFFNLSKAFDSVPHKALLEKQKDSGFNRLLLNWIANYLTNRKQQVVVNGENLKIYQFYLVSPKGRYLDHYCS